MQIFFSPPFAVLTVPSRAVVSIDPVTIEVQLKGECKTKSEDEVLKFSIFKYRRHVYFEGPPFYKIFLRSSCKRSQLE